ncbi:hypothetical protein BGX28_003953 [Mortierella sp. GBA30]|nr:hypothetical protein BGX28_003953 [Mortierella sp. GBA30]
MKVGFIISLAITLAVICANAAPADHDIQSAFAMFPSCNGARHAIKKDGYFQKIRLEHHAHKKHRKYRKHCHKQKKHCQKQTKHCRKQKEHGHKKQCHMHQHTKNCNSQWHPISATANTAECPRPTSVPVYISSDTPVFTSSQAPVATIIAPATSSWDIPVGTAQPADTPTRVSQQLSSDSSASAATTIQNTSPFPAGIVQPTSAFTVTTVVFTQSVPPAVASAAEITLNTEPFPASAEQPTATAVLPGAVTTSATTGQSTNAPSADSTSSATVMTATPTMTATTTTTTTTTAYSPNPTACGDLAAQGVNKDSVLSYQSVVDCYRAQPFNQTIANSVLSTLDNFFRNIYVFLDSALVQYGGPFSTASVESAHEASSGTFSGLADEPFSTPAVDLLAGLQKIRSTQWSSDYDFSMAITRLLISIHDGHVDYSPDCYNAAMFQQPIYTFAPVINGVQSVKIYGTDQSQQGVPQQDLSDCVVATIDDVPALKAIQDFADRSSSISKDPGVRLNDAMVHSNWLGSWGPRYGSFMLRTEIPAKASMDYSIQCGSDAPLNITVPWIVKPFPTKFPFGKFTDTATYWSSQCLVPFTAYNNHLDKERTVTLPPWTVRYLERIKVPFRTGGYNDVYDAQDITLDNATLVSTTDTSAFYMLNNAISSSGTPLSVCVVVIATETSLANPDKFPTQSEYSAFAAGVVALAKQGCKKLIFDMTNNGGGAVDFALFINQLFFPKSVPFFAQDLRSDAFVQKASLIEGQSPIPSSRFDARTYVSLTTGSSFQDQSMFTNTVSYTRGGVTDTYTQKSRPSYNTWSAIPTDTLPWAAGDMAIVTNGHCGSSGALIAARFAITHGVKTYAVGGVYQKPLSFFSFPGGFVVKITDVIQDMAGVPDAPAPLPIKGSLTCTMAEVYAQENGTIPLEYDTQYFAASTHLDQKPSYIDHPDQVWLRVAADF